MWFLFSAQRQEKDVHTNDHISLRYLQLKNQALLDVDSQVCCGECRENGRQVARNADHPLQAKNLKGKRIKSIRKKFDDGDVDDIAKLLSLLMNDLKKFLRPPLLLLSLLLKTIDNFDNISQ